MIEKNLFQPPVRPNPRIYAYSDKNPDYEGLLKIGMTEVGAEKRVKEQYPVKLPFGPTHTIELDVAAIREDGTFFRDQDVHNFLRAKGVNNPDGEWFECSVKDVHAAISSLKKGQDFSLSRSESFQMRAEQADAVLRTENYFKKERIENPNKSAHFLWNAKMRFGKTFAAYKLANKMHWTKILIVTFKPAVQASWKDDLEKHIDFENWAFVSKTEELHHKKAQNIACFISFQDLLGKATGGGVKIKNRDIHTIEWDCVIFDEYHYGAWRESSQDLFKGEENAEIRISTGQGLDIFDKDTFPIKSEHFLYLSGTPFRALQSGEFIEDQIFNWTYSDEQNEKINWEGPNNPYSVMPSMSLLTYKMPNALTAVANSGEFDEFDLNEFFTAFGEGEDAYFKHADSVQSWLNLLRGMDLSSFYSNLRAGARTTVWPFSNTELLVSLQHTFWFLPSISSCYAMKNLLRQKHNKFYNDYQIIVAAGNKAGQGVKALPPVLKKMGNPVETKSITLSCGKLATGVTVRPWTGIFMLKNLSTPETYFQAAFRVQTPWYLKNPSGNDPNETLNLKPHCFVFDFAPTRALRQIMDYSCRLSVDAISPEKKVADFIKFLPILAFDGSTMQEVNAEQVLDIAMSGTSATLLAKRWESPLLVNVDNLTLERILGNDDALRALMQIEGFRSLNEDITTVINKTQKIAKTQTEETDKKDKSLKISEEKKEINSIRKKIRDKLIKFATRIPIFMYLTDYREETLKDVITKIEPDLFKKVTGLSIDDFKLLISLNVFNGTLMNDAVYKFKRYEDASFDYLSARKPSKYIGLWNTIVRNETTN